MKLLLCLFLLFIVSQSFALEIWSNSFENNGFIPQKYTCKGEDISPSLSWKDVPEGTESFVIICDDPDAPSKTWVHWVIYDIPKEIRELNEGIANLDILDFGAKQGINDFGIIGYGGPCPPPGKPHRYFFKLIALNKKLDLPPGLTKEEVLKEVEQYIIGKAELIGKYVR